jgi:DMSO/TMAO reductase YedYZ molybdopterin-dependent catalytic subunit
MKKPGIFHGALTGFLLTIPVVALFYFGLKIVGLPFVPFDLFDWISRTLPGAIITFGIENMVALIRGLDLGSTAVVAKAAEQTLGIIIFLILGIIAGIILNIVLRGLRKSIVLWGAILGFIFAIPIEIITLIHNRTSSVSLIIVGLWIMALFLAWGIVFGLIYRSIPGFREKAAPVDAERRTFMGWLAGIAAASAAASVFGGVLFQKKEKVSEQLPWSATHTLPNADAAVKPAPGTRAEFTPVKDHYRIDIDTMPPRVDIGKWRLKIMGLVNNPKGYTIDEIRSMPAMNQFITIECISNPIAGDLIGTQRWTGVSLKHLLPELGIQPEATHFDIKAVDGFHETISLEDINNDERIMLAYAWDGLPLTIPHGFPLRIYIPDHYGMKQPKWIESMEAVAQGQEGYWVERGWDRKARVRTTSVIDTVAVDSKITGPNGKMLVPVGGIAYSGARGISKVEIQVDGDDWREAQLRTPLSDTTWVIWRYDYPYQEGEHTFVVRCYEGDGTPQIEATASPHPSGATGFHSVTMSM